MMHNSTSTSWRLDGDGFLRWATSGYKVARVTPSGLWLWDDRSRCERLLSWGDMARLFEQETRKTT